MTLATPVPSISPDAEKSLRLPLGLASPLWMMIGSAAMVGATFFWATRWMRPGAVEAVVEKVSPKPEPEVQAAVEKAATVAEATTEAVADLATQGVAETAAGLEAMVDAPVETVIDPVTEAPVAIAKPAVEPAPEPVMQAVEKAADDLTRLSGVGAKMAANLAARGVTRFEQIAAWSADEVAALDKDMKLMGRIGRDGWVDQAKAFLKG